MLWWCVVLVSLSTTWSLTHLERLVVEMGHWQSDSLTPESWLSDVPSDRKLLETAKSYVEDASRTGGPGHTARPHSRVRREVEEFGPSDDRTFLEYRIGDFNETALTVYGPFPTSFFDIDVAQPIEVYLGDGSVVCTANYGRLLCLDGLGMEFTTTELGDREIQYYQIVPADQEGCLYTFQIKYSELQDGDHVDAVITVFFVNITSGQDVDGNRILLKDVSTLTTYQFEETVSQNVTYQANHMELLKVSDGIFLAFFDPDTLLASGLNLLFFSFTTGELIFLDSSGNSDSILNKRLEVAEIKDLSLFADGSVLYLCVADSEYSALFSFTNQGEDTALQLDSLLPAAHKVEYFHNSFGSYLILVDDQDLSTTYILKDGNLIKMQENLSLGSHDKFWQSVGVPDPGSLFSEQELVLVKEGSSVHFLHFTAPGMIEVSRSIALPTVDGVAVPFGLERVEKHHPHNNDSSNYIYGVGVVVPEPNPNSTILNYYNYTTEELAQGTSNLEVFQFEIIAAKSNVYSNIDDLSNKVGQLENLVWEIETLGAVLTQNETFDDLIALDEDFSVDLNLEANTLVFTGNFSKLDNVSIELEHSANQSSFEDLDYNKPESLISQLEDKTNETHDDFIYKYSVLSSQSVSLGGSSISVAKAVVYSLSVNTLDTVTIDGHDMASFLSDTLRTNAGATFDQNVLFQDSVTVSDTTTFVNDTATTSAIPLKPYRMLDHSLANNLSVQVTFENLRVESQCEVSGTINGISLSDLVLDEGDTQQNISGVKTFSEGLTALSQVTVEGTINDESAEEYLSANFIYRYDPLDENNQDFSQTINVGKFYFNEIIVKNNLTVEVMGSDNLVNVSSTELDRIVVNNVPGNLSGDFVFTKPVTINNLLSSSINLKNPADIVIDGANQTFNYPLHIGRLVTNNITTDSLNGINLSEDVARTDEANNFTVPVTFTTIGVESSINMTDGAYLAGGDVSSMNATAQQYSGVVTITESLTIDQDDLTVNSMDFGLFTFDPSSFEDQFLFKDTAQTLPNIAQFGVNTTLYFQDLCLRSTLDGLDMKSGVIHSGNEVETSDVDIFFTGGLTKFYKDVLVYDGEDGVEVSRPEIGSHNIKSMEEQIFCGPNENGLVTFDGVKTLRSLSPNAPDTELTSYYDVTVEGNLVINGRDFVESGNLKVVRLGNNNDFKENVVFNSSSPGLDVDARENFVVSGATVTASDEDSVLLNGKNIKQFDQDIVKKTGTFNISTPVSLSVSMAGGASAIITDGGDIDGTNLVTYLEDRVLLDEAADIPVDIRAASLTFKDGLTLAPELGDYSYFAGRDLADYSSSLFLSSDSSLSGVLNLTGGLNVTGDLIFLSGVFPFNVDLGELNSTGLFKSRDQTVDLEYYIGNITKVEEIITNTVAGVELEDICLIDENCNLTCSPPELDPCLQFSETIEASGGTNFSSFDLSGMLAAVEANSNNYTLDLLEISEAGADLNWTISREEEESVSELYSKLVVRSDKDWASSDPSATVTQEISGDVTLSGCPRFYDIFTSSGKVNDNTAAEVDLVGLVADSALKSAVNNFTCHKTFFSNLTAASITVTQLRDVVEINDLNIADYRRWILTVDDESSPGNESYEQEITCNYKLDNGIAIKGRLDVEGDIDGLTVDEIVRSNVVNTSRDIPEVTFSDVVELRGNIEASGTDFQTNLAEFMDNERLRLSTNDTISLHLNFLGTVSVSDEVTVTKLNDIPANTWVKTGVEVNTVQSITGRKVFEQEVVLVNGDLNCDNISGTDLSTKYEDAIKHDEDALIAGPTLEFISQTKVVNEVFNAQFTGTFDDDATNFISDLKRFINNLYDFYSENIVNVLPLLVKELEVAKKIDLGTTAFLEEASVPAKLTLDEDPADGLIDFNTSLVTSLRLGENQFSLNFRVSSSCSLPTGCWCEQTELLSHLDPSHEDRVQSEDRIFSFSLPVGTFTLTSAVDSYSDVCSISEEEDSGLVVSGLIKDAPDLPARMNFLSPATVGTALTATDLHSLCVNCSVGYIADAVMWELGDSVFLAVASIFREVKVQLYRLEVNTGTWSDAGSLNPQAGLDFSHVHKLKVVKFFAGDGQSETVHLFIARKSPTFVWEVEMSEVVVYEMSQTGGVITPTSGMEELETEITVPGYVDMEVFLFQETQSANPQILLLVAENVNFNFGPHLSVLVTFMYNDLHPGYSPAILPDNVQFVADQLVKIEAATLSNHTVLIIAETKQLGVYKFVPYQGLRLVDSIKAGDIVDFTVFRTDVSGDEALNIYVMEAGQRTEMYQLRTEAHVPTVNLVFGKYQ